MFGSLLSFASLATWVQYPFTSLALMFDGIIFSVVSYSYNLFLLMAQLNMNSILGIADVLIDRLRALIMVFVVFRLAMSLINYLIDPGKATDRSAGGVALVKRIVITAAMLLSYNFVFALLNDLSAIVVGFNNGYQFQVIEGDSADSGGLLARLVFGTNSDGGIADYGREIASFTFQQFLRNNGSQEYDKVFDEIKDSNGNFSKVTKLADEVGKTVVYEYPFISAAVGLFLIYSIVKMAIEIGVRMFKILILQMLAPVAIISYIDPASEQKIWKNYTKAYLSTYTDAFIRIAAIFLSTAFISAITANLDTMFGSVSGSGATGMQKMLITVMVIIAGYRFALLLPKFVGGLFGVDLSGDSKGSFGKFMAGLGGLAIGGIAGGVSGLATGIATGAGFAGTAANMLSGIYGGASSGMKGKSIAEKIKNVNESNSKNYNRALDFARMGVGQTALRSVEGKLGLADWQNKKASKYDDNLKMLDAIESARVNAIKNGEIQTTDGTTLKYGTDKDSFAKSYAEHDLTYQTHMMEAERAKTIANEEERQRVYSENISYANQRYAEMIEAGKEKWTERAYQDDVNNNLEVKKSIDQYKEYVSSGRMTNKEGKITEVSKTSHDLTNEKGFKNAREANKALAKNERSGGATRRANATKVFEQEKK